MGIRLFKKADKRAQLLTEAYDLIHAADALKVELVNNVDAYRHLVAEHEVESDDISFPLSALVMHDKLGNNFYSLLRVEDIPDAVAGVDWSAQTSDMIDTCPGLEHSKVYIKRGSSPGKTQWYSNDPEIDYPIKGIQWTQIELLDTDGIVLDEHFDEAMSMRRRIPQRAAVTEFGQVFLDIIEADADNSRLRDAIVYLNLVISQTTMARDAVAEMIRHLRSAITTSEEVDDLQRIDQYTERYSRLLDDMP